MRSQEYRAQVALMLKVLPAVAREDCFAMHGGTAINLFLRDMPRLSVDVDLTYQPLEDRQTTLRGIREALERIKSRIEEVAAGVRVQHRPDVGKLLVSSAQAGVKVEVNLVARGTLAAPVRMPLCDRARREYDTFCTVPVVPFGQLYGGKICAALDRQHPRDLFDARHLLDSEGFADEVKQGFLLCLLGSDRPLHEIVAPTLQDQRLAMANQFEGMSGEAFSYEDFEATRGRLIREVHGSLRVADKEFLLGVHDVRPDWTLHDFERFPSVRWKLMNLQKLKTSNPEKHRAQYGALREALGT